MNFIYKSKEDNEFQDYSLFSSFSNIKIDIWVTIFFFVFATIFNSILFSDSLITDNQHLFSLHIPFFLLTLIALYIKKLYKYLHIVFVVLAVSLAGAVFIVGVSMDTHTPGSESYLTWTMLVMTGLFILFRING